MGKFVITEEEKRSILSKYKRLTNEQMEMNTTLKVGDTVEAEINPYGNHPGSLIFKILSVKVNEYTIQCLTWNFGSDWGVGKGTKGTLKNVKPDMSSAYVMLGKFEAEIKELKKIHKP